MSDKLDICDSFDSPVLEMVGKDQLSFPIIPVAKMATTIGAIAKQKKKLDAQKLINEAKLWGEEKLLMLKDSNYFSMDDLQNYVNSLDGAIEAVKVSLSIAGKSKEESEAILNRLEPWQTVRVANLVTQFMVSVEPELQKDEAEKKVEQIPVTTEVTETAETPKKEAQAPTQPKGYGDQ